MSDSQKNTKPNVPNLRFPGFSGEWVNCELGDIADITKGVGISKDQRSSEGMPCILYGELYTTYSTEIIEDVVSKTYLPENGLVKSKENDVIIPASGETAIDISTARCVTKSDVLLGGDLNIIRLRGQDGRFFSYQLNGVRKKDIAKIAQGVSIVHLHGSDLKQITVYYPSLSEQEKISSLLSLVDQRIAIQNKVIEDLKKLKTAICTELFSHGRTIPISLSEIGEYFSVDNLSKDDLSDSGAECILYGELFTTYGRVITNVKSRTSKNIDNGTTLSYSNDLLFPASTTVDAISLISPVAITKPGVILGGDMFGIRLETKYNNQYMSNLLFYCYREKLASYAQGSTIIHLHYRDIEKIMITVHTKEKQDRIAAILSLLDQRIANEQRIAEAYIGQKVSLIRQMFI